VFKFTKTVDQLEAEALSNTYLVGFSFQHVAPLSWLTLDSFVNLANVNNGSHGAVVGYFTAAQTLRVIKSVACHQSTNTMHQIKVQTDDI